MLTKFVFGMTTVVAFLFVAEFGWDLSGPIGALMALSTAGALVGLGMFGATVWRPQLEDLLGVDEVE